MRAIGILLIMLCLAFTGWTQHPYFYQLNDGDGLPSNEVYTLCQDDFNAFWLGSDAGLLKYDGFSFQTIEQPKNSHFSISNVQIYAGKTLWCQNFSGQIYSMSTQDQTLKLSFDAAPYVRNFPNYTLDDQGRAWVMTDSILFVLQHNEPAKQVFTRYELGGESTPFASIGTTKTGAIATVDYRGVLHCINPETQDVQKYELPFQEGYRYQFFETSTALVLMVERRNEQHLEYAFVEVIDEIEHTLKWQYFNEGKVLTYASFQGKQYVGTDKGLYVREQGRNKLLFKGKKIARIVEGKEGGVWCTSLQDGIFVIPSMDALEWTNDATRIEDQNISALAQKDDQTLIFGNYSGELFLLDRSSGNLEGYAPSSLPTSAVRKILWHNGNLYVARGNFEVYREERLVDRIDYLRNARDFCFSGDTLFYTRSDQTGYVLSKQGKWDNFTIRNKGGRKVVKTKEGIFILSPDGVFRWKNEQLTEVKFNNASILATTLTEVDGNLLIGTYNQGVLSLIYGNVASLYTTNNGLPDNEIVHFYANHGHYLIGTRKGLTIVDLSNGSVKTIDGHDGLASKEITESILLDSVIYLGTINGLFSLPISQQTVNLIPPTLKIVDISVGGNRVPCNDTLLLAYDDYQIRIQFSSVSLRSRGEYFIKYRLKGFREEWTTIPARQGQITFPSFPSGEYTFEIVAVNEDGIESEVVHRTVIVNRPIWQKAWFYGIILLVAIGIMWLVFKWRLNNLRRKAILKQKMVSAQLTALKAQMNPHFLFNTLNSLQDLILKQDFKSTNYYLSKYSTLMRMILTNSEKGEVDISEELKMLTLYLELEKLRFGDEFTFELICQEELENTNAAVPPMIIQPFVENALKHGLMHKHGPKFLKIHFYVQGATVFCEIEDNGIGRARSVEINTRQGRKYDSFSTQATDERMRLLQEYYGTTYTLKVMDLFENETPAGTKVIIEFPLH